MKIRPYITEKSVDLAKKGLFTVVVDKDMTKQRLISQIKESFNITAESVAILNKKNLVAKKAKGLAKDRGFKKAVLKLKEGEVLTGYESFLEQKKEKTADNKQKEVKK